MRVRRSVIGRNLGALTSYVKEVDSNPNRYTPRLDHVELGDVLQDNSVYIPNLHSMHCELDEGGQLSDIYWASKATSPSPVGGLLWE